MLSKKFSILLIATMACLMAACSGLKATSTGGTGDGGGGGNVTATIGGTISGLDSGASVVLQNNGGDALTVTANGNFVFKTPVTGPTDAYKVTVNTQPKNPNQICTVANGSGTAAANVTNVMVTCVDSFTIGGTVTGLVGTGFALQDQDGTITESLPISAATGNQAFTFTMLVPTGSTYNVTVATQPSNPAQTCVIGAGTGTGTATANVTSVVVTCAAVTYSVGGTVVGLAGVPPSNGPITDNSFIIQNVLGNTLIIPQNGPFTFATPEALNDQFQISVFHGPSSQGQGCTLWDYKGVVTTNITSIIVDCGHNDWTWIDGKNTAGSVLAMPQYGAFPTTAPTTIPNPFTNTPGARYGAAGWTDSSGSLFLFGGDGWELSGKSPADTLNFAMNDLWVCDMSWGDYCQWQLVGGYDPTPITVNGKATTVGAQIILGAQYAGGYPFVVPAGRLGASTWKDSAGSFWLFGGSDGNNFLSDLWQYNHSGLNSGNYTTTEGVWSHISGSLAADQAGVYPPNANPAPGARTNAVTWTDASGNLWLFGGYGYDGQGPAVLGFLNDLWEYTGGKWVFVGGSSTANQNGVYGQQGTPDSANLPGGRQEAVGWTDAHGNLWLFGGEGEDSTGTANGILNDMWMYNIASNQWTFVQGSMTANQTGAYGSQPSVGPPNTTGAAGTYGLAAASNSTYPGSRWGASGWADQGGNLWLFGGWGLDSSATNGNGALNDLWVYVPNSTAGQPGTWTWVKGSNTGSQNGSYGDAVIPYKTYEKWTPGGRSSATRWIDNRGQLWLFGGEGYDSTSTTGNGYLNDLWRYLPYRDN
ncbi:MAG TPA: kelch repeat-containing protein [Candidatus Eisenbacteria bacterium]|nr:kelch repeat-containing protein [Candidatus Eisenbacteria bacterium]